MEQLPFRFSNSAGWPKTPEGVTKLVKCPLTTHVVIGSFTVKARKERGGGTDFDVLDDGTASNNRNLPNGGIEDLLRHGPEMVRLIHEAGKQAVVSGAPFTPVQDAALAIAACDIGADEYESNRTCPNTESSIIAFIHELMVEHDRAVDEAIGGKITWRRKIGPYVNPSDRETQASQTVESTAAGIVACNTFPRARLRRGGKPIITATGTVGLGGLSGEAFRIISQINVEHFCELLQGTGKDVTGVGGINRIVHIEEYRQLGCVGVQVGAALFKDEDPAVLQRLGEDWAQAYA